jgi:hypothetical protein
LADEHAAMLCVVTIYFLYVYLQGRTVFALFFVLCAERGIGIISVAEYNKLHIEFHTIALPRFFYSVTPA